MDNNMIANELLEATNILVEQKLKEISFDKTEICKIVEKNPNYSDRYWVTNEAGLKFEAYSNSSSVEYSKGKKVYVLIRQGNYELTKIILGAYSADEIP
jgi:hypothetical protein